MKWYKSLTILQRINFKDLSEDICGIEFASLVILFGMRESIELLYSKLKQEGFEL